MFCSLLSFGCPLVLHSDLDVAIQRCIVNDNARILSTMLQHTLNDTVYDSEWSQNRVMLEHMSLAARCGSMECLALLMGEPDKWDWTGQLRNPECLLFAVKFHAQDTRVAHFVIDRLQLLKLRLDCADIMRLVYKHDLVGIAARLIQKQWYCVTEQDESYAHGQCLALIQEKFKTLSLFVDNDASGTVSLDDWTDSEESSDGQ